MGQPTSRPGTSTPPTDWPQTHSAPQQGQFAPASQVQAEPPPGRSPSPTTEAEERRWHSAAWARYSGRPGPTRHTRQRHIAQSRVVGFYVPPGPVVAARSVQSASPPRRSLLQALRVEPQTPPPPLALPPGGGVQNGFQERPADG